MKSIRFLLASLLFAVSFSAVAQPQIQAASVRYNGGWYTQNDAYHGPLAIGVSSPKNVVIEGIPDRDMLNVAYTTDFASVGSLGMFPDNVLAAAGYVAMGGESGLSSSNFEIIQNINVRGVAAWNGTDFALTHTHAAFPVTLTAVSGHVNRVRVEHLTLSDASMIPELSPIQGVKQPYVVSWDASGFVIDFTGTNTADSKVAFHRRGIDIRPASGGYLPALVNGNYFAIGVQNR